MLSPLPRRSGWAYYFAHSPQPYQPSPKGSSGRPAHRPFRGLLGVHSRYGLHTRAVTVYRDTLTRGFSHFVTSMTAPVASGGGVAGWDLHPLESAAFPRRTPQSGHRRIAASWPSELLDYLVGAQQECFGDRQPERLGGHQIDDEIELVRLLDREVGRLGSAQNFVDILGGTPEQVRPVYSIG